MDGEEKYIRNYYYNSAGELYQVIIRKATQAGSTVDQNHPDNKGKTEGQEGYMEVIHFNHYSDGVVSKGATVKTLSSSEELRMANAKSETLLFYENYNKDMIGTVTMYSDLFLPPKPSSTPEQIVANDPKNNSNTEIKETINDDIFMGPDPYEAGADSPKPWLQDEEPDNLCKVCFIGDSNDHTERDISHVIAWLDGNPGEKMVLQPGFPYYYDGAAKKRYEKKHFTAFYKKLEKASNGKYGKENLIFDLQGEKHKEIETWKK